MRRMSLAAARVNAQKTQTEVGKEVGVCKNIIIDWEKGRKHPTLEQLQKYCKACGCRPEDVDCQAIVLTRV